MSKGFVYALRSERCPCIKIGMTRTSVNQRTAEINSTGAYVEYGKWTLLDCRKVKDCRKIEVALHRRFADRRATHYGSARELFAISSSEVRDALTAIPAIDSIDSLAVSRMIENEALMQYFHALFKVTGLENFFGAQEAWTFSLYPSTNNKERYFTLNIDNHEVAFSGLSKGETVPFHCLVMDKLVKQDKAVCSWLQRQSGQFFDPPYKNAFPRSVLVRFEADLESACDLLRMGTVRRALLAYWYDYLLAKTDRGSRSIFARFHNYNAVSEIFRDMRERERFYSGA